MSKFVDYKRIKVSAGNGGDGAISFFRGIYHAMGPPSGGNGGKGGDVYVTASKRVTSLNSILNRYSAMRGADGKGKQMHGSNGEDVDIVVPMGTVVRMIEDPHRMNETSATSATSETGSTGSTGSTGDLDLIASHFKFPVNYKPQQDRIDMLLSRIPRSTQPTLLQQLELIEDQQRVMLLRGGRGGHGNPHFATHLIKGPSIAERGQPVMPVWLELELKTIADAGMVGLPNAGKSTLLKAVTNAHPRIAPFPFTTLNPYVGTIDFKDFFTMTIADIPGLIPGAHRNFGLGHRFLRHIERTKVIVYVVDLAGDAPWSDLAALQFELEAFKKGMTDRPSLVAANKADVSSVSQANFDILKASTSIPIVPISAKLGKNITALTAMMRGLVE